MSFEDEYKDDVEFEAESIVADIRDYAEHHHYEVDLFFNDVVKEIRKLLNDDGINE